ncbi:DUF3606 domain-containing protein [Pseudomonas sp. HMWF006]|uniref:DUF3606 domain-containing protein n=1 Tax=Pseudomonas sp. HMWF006 TaxID=2056843 RepID=UPI000D4BBAFA|nr:DUF3606 domain-containing protein [Pseudomonas sp. HMWF006]PTT02978.1 DUF3606 domain-containing protein [Pseudomonas sp. HMWF006]PTT61205.1 DUF3606 domain-containing protein [Pseudomonas sp. HMWF007]PTT95335.1 DUF3606 domain-containing protein [Pseudomonas sp. HMWF005]
MQQRNLVGSVDEIGINANDMFEYKYWAKKFGVTASELKSVVKAVGDSPSAVRSRIEKSTKKLSLPAI